MNPETIVVALYEVETDLIIHTKVRVTVEADNKDAALDVAAGLLPANHDREASRRWRATVDLMPPKGVQIKVVKAYHFEQASGTDKARKLG